MPMRIDITPKDSVVPIYYSNERPDTSIESSMKDPSLLMVETNELAEKAYEKLMNLGLTSDEARAMKFIKEKI